MRRWLYRLCRAAPTLMLIAGLVWTWRHDPFAQPFVERGRDALRLELERAMARRVTPEWLDTRLETALEEDDLDRAALLIEIGADRDPAVAPSPALAAEHRAREEAASAFWARAGACTRCAVEARSCESLKAIGICLIPFELTPAGDLNALRQEGWAAMRGEPVDELNVGLAVLGLGATGMILVSGPVSATAKIGATTLRVARRLGTLTAAFGGEMARLARLDVKLWPLLRYAAGRGPLGAALDTARLGEMERVSDAMTTVARRTSPEEALLLLRHVDSGEDAARLARVAEAGGKDTRKYFAALGRNRVFRALLRLSDTALAAAALIYALALNLLMTLAQFLGRIVLRGAAGLLRPV